MDENASRAVFLGVSVFVAIITITLIVTFYRTAKDSAAVANRYDITNTGNSYLNSVLLKEKITGSELRYLMNYYANDETVDISIYDQLLYTIGDAEDEDRELPHYSINNNNYWLTDYQGNIDINIRPNYNYNLFVETKVVGFKIIATFEN